MSPSRQVLLAGALYPPSCLALAERAFASLCALTSTAVDEGLEVSITPVPGAPPETICEFLNYLLCASLETRLAELTE